ncbi:MAG: tRNA 2-thiouridine(34) synthase MnmA [Deltaproteobacteria bacterium]|nr:tRNA 2-thiouridine(34) synthase MnmA [Deltaproteobacteria bacterium]
MSHRVAIALSGGVDSLVSASILKDEGHEVFGVHFITRGGKPPDVDIGEDAEIETASSVINGPLGRAAETLGIELYALDLKEAFTESVVRPFVLEYARGRTPNPCVACNRDIKFGALLEKVTELGATHLATGHYAGIVVDAQGRPSLVKGADASKDQSYFLAMVKKQALGHILFPLARLTKDKVREMARARSLSGIVRSESQDVCFAPGGDYRKILADWGMAGGPGPITDAKGRVLGTHSGLFSYTVGQRRGMGVAADRPLYVLRLEPGENRLVVGYEEEVPALSATVSLINWIEPAPLSPIRVLARVRYRSRPCGALLTPTGETNARLDFDHPVKALSPGQTAVFYSGDVVLGGGIID